MSLNLSPEQATALQALQRERDLTLLGGQLALAFPEVPGRLGDRYAVLIALAAERGAGHGFAHLAALARYLACWVALGAEFEARPGHEWAAAMLSASGQSEGGRIFQLCRGVREQLQARPGPGTPTPAAFDAALALLDAALQGAGDLGALANLAEPVQGGERRRLKLGRACDLDGLDLRRADTVAVQRYVLSEGQWARTPTPPAPAALTLLPPTAEPPVLPAQISVLCPPAGRDGGARLRLRTRAAHCCELHPWVRLSEGVGLREWRAEQAADISWPVPTPPAAPAPAAGPRRPQPAIAAEGSPGLHMLDVQSCSLRDSGTPLGEVHLLLATYPAEQHLQAWRREPWPLMSWPVSASEPLPSTPPTRLRLERDGSGLDTSAWQAGFDTLDRQLVEGLGRLASAFDRASGVAQGRLQAEPRLLCGSAGISWGYAERPQGLLAAPYQRITGMVDLIACQLNLRFAGTLARGGAQSRLSLHCAAAEALKLQWEGQPGDSDAMQAVAGVKASFRQPFVLVLDTVAQPELAVINAASMVSGALVGTCGLRQRPEGTGLQWFLSLGVEAASVLLQLHDPLLGDEEWLHPLLPAMTLLDWSLG